MKTTILLISFILGIQVAIADMKYHPISFVLSTEKESYYEGEKINFIITITNTDKQDTYPVLIPHTQNTGQKLFYLNFYDKANNTLILRFTEDRMLKMMVQDTGSVQIKYLKPLEQIVIPIYLNDFKNYYNYHTQNASHHSLGVPLFAGIYKVNVTYNPKGITLGDSIYNYYDNTIMDLPADGKLAMSNNGDVSNFCLLKIKRSTDSIVSIERKNYYVLKDERYYYYMSEYMTSINTSSSIHITNLPADSSSIPKDEYFYTHFTDLFAEYIVRFDDGDIKHYRKFTDYCPDYLYTEKYNDLKQKTLYALQLPDKRFYSVSYHQPENKIHWEIYCSADGTLCNVTEYIYNKNGKFVRKKVSQNEPCIEVEVNGIKRSYIKASLESE